MDRYTDHRGPQDAAVKYIARLKDLKDRAVLVVFRFGAIYGLMQMRIERFAERIEALDAEFCEVIEELLVDEFEAFAITFIFGFAVRGERVLETVDHGDEPFNDARGGALRVFEAFLLDAFAVVVKVRLAAKQRLAQLLQIGCQLGQFGVGFGRVGGNRFGGWL